MSDSDWVSVLWFISDLETLNVNSAEGFTPWLG